MTARRPSRTKFVDLKLSDVDFRETCLWFGISPELFERKLIEVRLDREYKTTSRKADKLLERIMAAPGDCDNLNLFDQLDRLDAKLDALTSARWPQSAPKSAKPPTTPGEES